MSGHTAVVEWNRQDAGFADHRYSREHVWKFDGGLEIPASASPHVVPAPCSNAANLDPEEAFVASLSSCHMFWFLSLAARKQFLIEKYVDRAAGTREQNQEGWLAVTRVVLRPQIEFGGERLPTLEQIRALHDEAHRHCFLANSVKTQITIESDSSFRG